MKKIAIFTNHYDPENFKINELVKEFQKELEVNVITQIPNYPKGSFYDGYGYFKNRESTSGNLKVKRLAVIPRKNNLFMLALNYITNAISMYAYGSFTSEKVDHVFAYVTSPIFLSWGALKLAKRNKVKSTLYLLDLWPASLVGALNLKNKFLIKFLEKISIKIYKRYDKIIVSSEGFIEELISYGIDASKISHLPQHANEIFESPISINPSTENLEIVFAGNIGEAQKLDLLVDAIAIIKDQNITNVHLTIVGDGRARKSLEANINNKGLDSYFTFVGMVPSEQVKEYLNNKHLGYVSLVDISPINKTIPAKIQAYMGYGLPILACAPGSVNNMVEKIQCGVVCKESKPEALAQSIISSLALKNDNLEAMSKRAIKYSKENFDIIDISKQFVSVMKEGS